MPQMTTDSTRSRETGRPALSEAEGPLGEARGSEAHWSNTPGHAGQNHNNRPTPSTPPSIPYRTLALGAFLIALSINGLHMYLCLDSTLGLGHLILESVVVTALLIVMLVPLLYYLVHLPAENTARSQRDSEEALAKMTERNRALLQSLPLGMAYAETNGFPWHEPVLVHVNSEFERITGLGNKALLGKCLTEGVEPLAANWPELRAMLKGVAEGGPTYSAERYIDNLGRWLHVSATRPSPGKLSLTLKDITHRKRIEAQMMDTRKEWQLVLDTISDAITIHDADFNIVRANNAARMQFNLPPIEHRKNVKCYEYFHGKHMPPAGCTSCKCLTDGTSSVSEVFEPHLSKFLEIRAMPIKDATGRPTALIHVTRDITERKALERTLHESEERFRNTFEQAAVGIAHVSPEGKWLRVNQRLCEITGRSREEILGMTFQDITHPEDVAEDLEYVRRMLSGELRNYSMHKRYLRKDGSTVWVNLTVSLVRWPDGRPNYFISVVVEITSNKEAEAELARSEKKFRHAIKCSPLGIVLTDSDGTMGSANPAFSQMVGYGPEELSRMRFAEITHPEDLDPNITYFKELMAGTRDTYSLTKRYIRKDGSVLWAELSVAMIDRTTEKPTILAMVQDITGRVTYEDRLRRSLVEKDVLLREVHHRVKNNMQLISSILSLQSAKMAEGEQKDIFEEMRSRIRSIALIHDKLYRAEDFSSLDFSGYLQSVISGLVSSFKGRGDTDLRLDLEATPETTDSIIGCGLIVNELVGNALKHAKPPEGQRLRISVETHRPREGGLSLLVSDNGQGLAEGFLLEEQDSLGFILVTALVNQMGAELDYTRAGGAHFLLRLPTT